MTIASRIKAKSLYDAAKNWTHARADYRSLIAALQAEAEAGNDEDDATPTPAKSNAVASQNQQVEQIINQVLDRLPKSVAGDVRNAIARSPNKLAALQVELKKRNINLSENMDRLIRNPDSHLQLRAPLSSSGDWKWDKDDIVMSPKTGRTFVILGRQFDKAQNQAVYLYRSKDGKGIMPVSTAHKTLMKINEAATVGATSSSSIATVSNPHISPGKARGKKSYTGSPGKSGTSAPAQPKPKKQSPSDNALNMKGTSLFGGPAIKR